mmetsp:Transcript_12844/g.16341  ORF Transcript_12844/g.16341 Transcript_12844/m.16341 type:complete len:236 (+) Transcript_12844:2-709(+)
MNPPRSFHTGYWADEKCPPSDTMEGMIYNANEALDASLESTSSGSLSVPSEIVQKCLYVVILKTTEAGLILSKRLGHGVIVANLANNPSTVSNWSPPCAVSFDATGVGLTVGASVSYLLFFIMDAGALADLLDGHGARIDLSLTVGPTEKEAIFNRRVQTVSSQPTYVYAYSKGFFPSVDVRTSRVDSLLSESQRFYGLEKTLGQILLGDKEVVIPENCGVSELFEKLDMLRNKP